MLIFVSRKLIHQSEIVRCLYCKIFSLVVELVNKADNLCFHWPNGRWYSIVIGLGGTAPWVVNSDGVVGRRKMGASLSSTILEIHGCCGLLLTPSFTTNNNYGTSIESQIYQDSILNLHVSPFINKTNVKFRGGLLFVVQCYEIGFFIEHLI